MPQHRHHHEYVIDFRSPTFQQMTICRPPDDAIEFADWITDIARASHPVFIDMVHRAGEPGSISVSETKCSRLLEPTTSYFPAIALLLRDP